MIIMPKTWGYRIMNHTDCICRNVGFKGQIKPKADWGTVDSPEKQTNGIVFFAFLLLQQTKQIFSFLFWEISRRANLLLGGKHLRNTFCFILVSLQYKLDWMSNFKHLSLKKSRHLVVMSHEWVEILRSLFWIIHQREQEHIG